MSEDEEQLEPLVLHKKAWGMRELLENIVDRYFNRISDDFGDLPANITSHSAGSGVSNSIRAVRCAGYVAPTATNRMDYVTIATTGNASDFGDMIHTFTACEPAVCMAYIALEKNDPLADIQEVLKGFHDRYALPELELTKVVYLMCVRSCITLTMAAYRMKLFPENNYISVDNNQAFHFLSRMKNEDLESWSNALVDYCGA